MAQYSDRSEPIPVSASRTADEIAGFLRTRLGEILDVSEASIDLSVPATTYGLSSTEAVILAGELAGFVERELPSQILLEVSDLAALVQQLGIRESEQRIP